MTTTNSKTKATLRANPALGNIGNWQERHNSAIERYATRAEGYESPLGWRPFEGPLVVALMAWTRYAEGNGGSVR